MLTLDEVLAQVTPSSQALAAIERACTARSAAYCPYSGFAVGACVAFSSENDVAYAVGANVENASYPLGICAERSAICAAVMMGLCNRNIDQHVSTRAPPIVALAAECNSLITPCGACRQVISEMVPDAIVICVSVFGKSLADNRYMLTTISKLLPFAFDQKALESS